MHRVVTQLHVLFFKQILKSIVRAIDYQKKKRKIYCILWHNTICVSYCFRITKFDTIYIDYYFLKIICHLSRDTRYALIDWLLFIYLFFSFKKEAKISHTPIICWYIYISSIDKRNHMVKNGLDSRTKQNQ